MDSKDQTCEAAPATSAKSSCEMISLAQQLEQEQSHIIRRLAEIEQCKAALKENPALEQQIRLLRGY